MRPLDDLLKEGLESGQIGIPVEPHGEHAMGFFSFLDQTETLTNTHVIDLGSGVGLPGLVLADRYPESHWTLIERRGGRATLLRRAVRRLQLSERVRVACTDATTASHGPLRGSADYVVARSFGPPGDVAECATGLLVEGGSLVVSEPPGAMTSLTDRWPTGGLETCGLLLAERWETTAGSYVRLERTTTDIGDLPRRGSRRQLLF